MTHTNIRLNTKIVRYNSLISELQSLEQDLKDVVERSHYNAFMMYSSKVKFVNPKVFKEILNKED